MAFIFLWSELQNHFSPKTTYMASDFSRQNSNGMPKVHGGVTNVENLSGEGELGTDGGGGMGAGAAKAMGAYTQSENYTLRGEKQLDDDSNTLTGVDRDERASTDVVATASSDDVSASTLAEGFVSTGAPLDNNGLHGYSGGEHKKIRIAVCMAGFVRSLIVPRVYWSVRKNLLEKISSEV